MSQSAPETPLVSTNQNDEANPLWFPTGKENFADDAKAIHDGMLNGDLLRDMDAATADAYAALKVFEALDLPPHALPVGGLDD